MVRRILFCPCRSRFVSDGRHDKCETCRVLVNSGSSHSPETSCSDGENASETPNKRARVAAGGRCFPKSSLESCDSHLYPQHQSTIELPPEKNPVHGVPALSLPDSGDRDAKTSQTGGSHSDSLANQEIIEILSDNEFKASESDDNDDGQILSIFEPKMPDSATLTTNADTCFICGTELSKMKRRLDHIKRCSKKFGIFAEDIRFNVDLDIYDEKPAATLSLAKMEANPYAKKSDWHGSSSAIGNTVQSTMDKFVKRPLKTVNEVLLAGAKKIVSVASSRDSKQPANKVLIQRKGGRFQRKVYTKACPAYKKIPGTDFICDGFYYANSDHWGGLSSAWEAGIVYCSTTTAQLVNQKLGVDKKYIHPLPLSKPTIIKSRGKNVTVTLIDANHCPGAVMFLFQFSNYSYLHVGDFRWDRDTMTKDKYLLPYVSRQIKLNELFLDTTYCNPKYSLPPQRKVIEATIDVFQKELVTAKDARQKVLFLFGAYTIGKERIYLSVAEHFGMKVWVDTARLRSIATFGWPQEKMRLLTTKQADASLWVVPLQHITLNKLPEYFQIANKKPFETPYKKVIAFRPTGWTFGATPGSGIIKTHTSGNVTVHGVPYSEHSSFPELVDCLYALRPEKITPTVNCSKSGEQVDMLLNALRNRQTRLPFTKVSSGSAVDSSI